MKNIGNAFILAIMAVALLLTSCTGGVDSQAESPGAGAGSIDFSLVFERPSELMQQAQSHPLNKQIPQAAISPYALTNDVCTDYGLTTITGSVYNAASTKIATGGPWECYYHQGTFSNIPVGSGYTVVFEAEVSGTPAWRGQVINQSVIKDQTTTLPKVVMNYIGNDTIKPTVVSVLPLNVATNVPVTSAVTATFSEDMLALTLDSATFTLMQGSTPVAGAVTYDVATRTATFTPAANLAYATGYTATVVGGNLGVSDKALNFMQSDYSCAFTTAAAPVDPPAAPTGVSATAGDTTAAISWGEVTGATSYNLYWSTASGFTTGNSTGVSSVTTPYTHSGLTNGTTYYYIVTAVNTGGESTASSQVSATPVKPVSGLMGGAVQNGGVAFNAGGANAWVTTFAGSAGLAGSFDANGTAARFNGPTTITTDGANLYVAGDDHTIRKVKIATGAVTTLAGSAGAAGSANGTGTEARFNLPYGITTDGTNLYVSDYNNATIRKVVIATGAVSTLAGAGVAGSVDGTGTAARFYGPYGITTDGANLYVADSLNHTIRKIVIATGTVTTLAGSPGVTGATDDIGAGARFNGPVGVTTDGTNLYVGDYNNHVIRKVVIATGEVTTLAGSAGVAGTADATGTAAQFNNPYEITTDGTNLYVADAHNHTIRKIVIATGAVTTLAGNAGATGSTDGAGTAARFYNPTSIVTDGTNLYVADYSNHTIRKISSNLMGGATKQQLFQVDTVTTLAGSAGLSGTTDATGTAARFNSPNGITTDGTNLYVADDNNHIIRKVVIATGVVTTLAGSAGVPGSADGTGRAALFNHPYGITTDGTNLYVTDYSNHLIRKVVIATGLVTTLAGSAGVVDSTDGTGPAARFNYAFGITTDGTNLYVADCYNNTIRKVVIATGVVTTLAGNAGTPGSTDETGPAARFYSPMGITTDGANLYVADTDNHAIRKVVIATGAVTTLAGSAGSPGSTDETGPAARFYFPIGITTDGANLYVADKGNHTIRQVVIATGVVTTLAGSAGTPGSTDATGPAARFNIPKGITTDGKDLYVTDEINHTIRKVASLVPPQAPTDVSVTGGNGQATLTWTSVPDATSYNVYYRTAAGVTTTNGTKVVGAISGTAISSLTNGTTYYFVVIAVNAGGESAVSSEVSVKPLVVPTGVQAAWSNGEAIVQWNSVSGATSYNVYMATESGLTKNNYLSKAGGAKVSGLSGTSCIKSGLSNGTTYYFVVTAVSADGESESLTEVSVTLMAPPDGVAALSGNNQATISWNSVSGANSYNLYYATETGVTKDNYASIAGGTKVSTDVVSPYTRTGLTSGTTYYLVVTAVNANGESQSSAEVNIRAAGPSVVGTVLLPRSGQTTTFRAGDDGSLQKGRAWPNPRFTNADGSTPISGSVVMDQVTGLIWSQDANAPGPPACGPATAKDWQEAFAYMVCLNTNNYLGYNDWRLPNTNELRSLINYEQANPATWLNSQGFSNVQTSYADYYITSSTDGGTTLPWMFDLSNGSMSTGEKTWTYYIWPVRAGRYLPVTGQTTSYAAGDDGALQKGVAWPSPRFTNADGSIPISGNVVVDQLTNLMWSQNAYTPGPPACTPLTGKYWQDALAHIACLNTNNYLGYHDWRLPNVNELNSLVNVGQASSMTWLNNQGFSGVHDFYWTSSTYMFSTGYGWYISMDDGAISNSYGKNTNKYIWPVRGGLIPVPDTGQTTSYTTTFGEDHDYLINPPSYTDNGNGTVTDNVTGLMWQQSDDDITRDWDAAGTYCADLTLAGYTDWRLPKVNELMGLASGGVYNPAIETTAFPGTKEVFHWTSTTDVRYTSYAWTVNFSTGLVSSNHIPRSYYVRCVR